MCESRNFFAKKMFVMRSFKAYFEEFKISVTSHQNF